jgi:hypothetical protein
MVEHVTDGAAQRLSAVEHHQDRPGDLQAALPQPDQQVADDGGVLGRALGQGERDLGPVQRDPQRDHAAVVGHPDPVHQQRHQLQGGQVLGEQLSQGVLGSGHEPARHRRLGGPRRGLLNAAANRFQPTR